MLSDNVNTDFENNVDEQWQNLRLNDEEKEIKDMAEPYIDNKALRMMKLMGFTPGLGLGKNEQGITAPVEVISQIGKSGLGLEIKKIERTSETWDFDLEEIIVEEKVEWLENIDEEPQFTFDDYKKWIVEGVPSLDTEESNFCDKDILQNILKGKGIFDELDLKELCYARARANPFETIRCVFFMNRAALKMANIDAATDFMFTNIDYNPAHKNNGPYYFADVCAGPGGFTEYVLWRKKWAFKGFGLTLKDENDFKMHESVCASPVTFLPLYGAKGDGNVCCPENIKDFKTKVLHETDNRGVHFMMSDGGFSVEGNENLQEVLSKNIYICQCLIALEILRNHGHFVTKVFDIFTNFSVGLLYLMFRCFEKVAILKPNSSRPANSERYFICYNLKDGTVVKNVRKYLRKIVYRLWNLKSDKCLDVTEIVPLSIIKNDSSFYNYICKSNEKIAKRQIVALKKLAAFCRNPSLNEYRQDELRNKCLTYWQIPDKPKSSLPKMTVEDLLFEVVDKRELLLVQPRELKNISQISDLLADLNDWKFAFMQSDSKSPICNFYAGIGASKVYKLQNNRWTKMKNIYLPRGTLLYGELVKEKIVMNKGTNEEISRYSLHVIDALRLGDISLADLNFNERGRLIKIFCKSINHEFRSNSVRIRAKFVNPVDALPSNNHIKINGLQGNYICALPNLGMHTKEEFYEINSVLFLKTNENQSFHSTYVLRAQVFLNENEGVEKKYLPLQKFVDLIIRNVLH